MRPYRPNTQRPLSGGMPIRVPLRINPIYEKKDAMWVEDLEKGSIINEDLNEHNNSSQNREDEKSQLKA
jgi:hypothetical protein